MISEQEYRKRMKRIGRGERLLWLLAACFAAGVAAAWAANIGSDDDGRSVFLQEEEK